MFNDDPERNPLNRVLIWTIIHIRAIAGVIAVFGLLYLTLRDGNAPASRTDLSMAAFCVVALGITTRSRT